MSDTVKTEKAEKKPAPKSETAPVHLSQEQVAEIVQAVKTSLQPMMKTEIMHLLLSSDDREGGLGQPGMVSKLWNDIRVLQTSVNELRASPTANDIKVLEGKLADLKKSAATNTDVGSQFQRVNANVTYLRSLLTLSPSETEETIPLREGPGEEIDVINRDRITELYSFFKGKVEELKTKLSSFPLTSSQHELTELATRVEKAEATMKSFKAIVDEDAEDGQKPHKRARRNKTAGA
eukprot:gb/GEZN01015246.1/.p1 GENE.gb/GEZN01015246.1/~~gb/GEZN01015246.1/.p1  ORF type:complete len:236 (+),score=41.55 gb/GEZN01015246.1/:34-741(+)